MNNQIFLLSLDSIKIKCWFNYCFLKNYTFHKLDCEQSPGWSCERGNGAKRVKVKNKKPRGSSPSAILLSPVLPNLDSTDWRGTACSLSTSRPQNFLFSSFFSKSRVQASSEVQTKRNCCMYAILLPVISAADLTS